MTFSSGVAKTRPIAKNLALTSDSLGNATPSLKAVASYITDDVSSDGLFKAVEYAFSLAENG